MSIPARVNPRPNHLASPGGGQTTTDSAATWSGSNGSIAAEPLYLVAASPGVLVGVGPGLTGTPADARTGGEGAAGRRCLARRLWETSETFLTMHVVLDRDETPVRTDVVVSPGNRSYRAYPPDDEPGGVSTGRPTAPDSGGS